MQSSKVKKKSMKKKASISHGPIKTQSSTKFFKSSERTDGNKPKTNQVSNSNLPQTGILNKLMQHRGPKHPCAFKIFILHHNYSRL